MFPILTAQPVFSPLLYSPVIEVDASEPSSITKSYINIVPTGAGTIGTQTITASATVAALVPIGAKLKIGGTDIYTVRNVSTTNITIEEVLTSTYGAGSALAQDYVSQWNDLSGHGYNLTQSTNSLKPVYIPLFNGAPALWFPTGGMVIPSGVFSIPNRANTMFAVGMSTLVDANDRSIITLAEGGSGRYVLRYSQTAQQMHFVNNTSNANPVVATAVIKGNRNLYTCSFDGSTGITIAINNGSDFTASTGAAENGCNSGAIGANGGITTAFMRGYINQLTIYGSLLGGAQQSTVKQSIGSKITLPTLTTVNAGLTSPDLVTFQGISWDGTYYYTTGTDELVKWDANWVEVARNATPIADAGLTGAGINHCGDLEVLNGEIYIPMEIYPSGPYAHQWVCVFNASTLAFVRKYDISAQATEISSLAYNSTDGYFYAASFVSREKILKYDVSFNFIGTLYLSSYISSMQGLTFFNGYMYLSSSESANNNLVSKFTTAGEWLENIYLWTATATAEMEGLANDGTNLIFLLSDTTAKAYFLNIV